MFGRRVVAVALLALLLMPLTAPAAAEWEEDSWLSNIIGPERLAECLKELCLSLASWAEC